MDNDVVETDNCFGQRMKNGVFYRESFYQGKQQKSVCCVCCINCINAPLLAFHCSLNVWTFPIYKVFLMRSCVAKTYFDRTPVLWKNLLGKSEFKRQHWILSCSYYILRIDNIIEWVCWVYLIIQATHASPRYMMKVDYTMFGHTRTKKGKTVYQFAC